jgi:RimJ/RimL family protein N-acetyltransferase
MLTRVPDGPLAAGAFVLRSWKPEEASRYLEARDEEVFRWTTETREATADQLASIIEKNLACPEWVALAITRRNGQIIGNIALGGPDADGKSAEASYWLAREGRGIGAASAALNAVTDWAFANGYECVFLKIAPDNTRSLAVARRCGFEKTGPHDERLRFERRVTNVS